MTKKIIVANWKLNPETPREAKALALGIKKVASKVGRKVEVVICPPAIFMGLLTDKIKPAKLGGQDAYWGEAGAHTGEVNARMFKYSGANYVIAGHSEKRASGDTDQLVNKKVLAILAAGLKVILCVGEKERDLEGRYFAIIKDQLITNLAQVPKKFASQIVVAYEPIWAIGEGAKGADTPTAFLETAIYIKKILAGLFGSAPAHNIPVLYGGSVSEKNAGDFLTTGQAGGLLVGRASLRADQFGKIISIANKI